MTRDQKQALKGYKHVGKLDIPPQNQGQMVLVAYGCTDEYIYERRFDQSDGSVTIIAYAHPIRDDAWDPWNGVPRLGKRIGEWSEAEKAATLARA